MDSQTTPQSPETNESDEFVFLLMAEGNDSEKLQGRELFYKRYRNHLFNSCRRLCASRSDNIEEDAQDLFCDVLLVIVENAHTYKRPNETDVDIVEFSTKAWINQIAKNVFIDNLKELALLDTVSVDSEELEASMERARTSANAPIIESPFLEQAKKCLDALTPKERGIMSAYYAEKDFSNLSARGKEGVTQLLAEEYDTTQQNIRKIVSRSKKKLEDCISNRTETK